MRLHRMFAGNGRIFFIGAALLSAAGFARAADLPAAVVQNANVSETIGTIKSFVQARITDMSSTSAASRTDGRDSLIRQIDKNNPDGTFVEAYCGEVAAQMQPLLKTAEPAVRVNAGIVISKLLSTRSQRLQGLVPVLLTDDSPAVTIYGLKAAELVMDVVYANPQAQVSKDILAGLVEAVKKHKAYGMLAKDAYRICAPNANTPKTANGVIIDEMNALLAARVQIYAADMPTDINAEALPANLLTGSLMADMKPEQKIATIQNLADLVVVASSRMDPKSSIGRTDRSANVKIFAQALRKFINAGGAMPMADAVPAISPLADLTDSKADGAAALAQTAHNTLRAQKGLEKLQPPPEVLPPSGKSVEGKSAGEKPAGQ